MKGERFEIRFPQELLERIDRWRDRQTISPTRAAAIRYLIESRLNELRTDDKASTLA